MFIRALIKKLLTIKVDFVKLLKIDRNSAVTLVNTRLSTKFTQ